MSKKELFTTEIRRIVKSIVKNYKPEKIILFGSLARGDFRRARDMDLLVIKRTGKDPWQRLYEVDRYIEHKVPIDILVYTPREIRQRLRMNDFFVRDITRKGKVLYAK